MLSMLPREIQDYIVYLAGIDVAVCLCNEYVIKQLIHTQQKHFLDEEDFCDYVLYSFSGTTLEYLVENGYLTHLYLIQRKPPIHTTHYIEAAVEHNDILKLQLLDRILPKIMVPLSSKKYAIHHGFTEIVDWIQCKTPIEFINWYVKPANV